MSEPLAVTPAVVIPAKDLTWVAVRAGGPGGQNVNKVASKVELRFDLAGTVALPPDAKARLRNLAGARLDAEGKLLIVSQLTRDQGRNLDDAREKLATMIRQALVRPTPRRKTRPTQASKRRRLDEKRRTSDKKRARRTGD